MLSWELVSVVSTSPHILEDVPHVLGPFLHVVVLLSHVLTSQQVTDGMGLSRWRKGRGRADLQTRGQATCPGLGRLQPWAQLPGVFLDQ